AIQSWPGVHFRPPSNRPFTSDLSGQDFWTLTKAGSRPISLVMGNCVYHVAHQGLFQAMGRVGKNVEMENYTQALYDARELALSRMQAEAEAENAEGIVGAQVQENNHGWGSHGRDCFAVGTSVAALPGPPPRAAPALVLPMTG